MADPKVSINGNTVITNGQATAWFVLRPQRWNWLTDADRDGLIVTGAQILAALPGHRVHYRVTTRSRSWQAWRDALAAASPAGYDPLPGWQEYTNRTADYLAGLDMHDKVCFVGVDLRKRSAALGLLAGLWGKKLVDDVGRVVARSGWDARPCTVAELEWLFRRSVLLGFESPTTSGIDGPWEADDMPALLDAAQWSAEPYGRTVKITAGGETRYAATAVIGRMQTLDSADPWLCVTDRLDFPVEISVTADILNAETTQRGVRSMILRATNQADHYAEHKQPAPLDLQAGIDKSLEVQSQLDQGFGTDLATRCDGWVRLTVTADSEEETLARRERVVDAFKPLISVETPSGQYGLTRELIPGQRQASTAHRRHLPVKTLAGGMAQATSRVGHEAGHYRGYTVGAGGMHPVFWDPHRAMEMRDRSGLCVIAGVPGAGKSSLLFQICHDEVWAGAQAEVLDPGGLLATMCDLDEFAGVSRHTDLMSARPGTLNPNRVIADPVRRNYESDAAFEHQVSMVESQRRQLDYDILLQLLPPAIAEMADTQIALRQAVRRAPAHQWASPRDVLSELVRAGGHAGVVSEFLEDVSRLPIAQLIFPTGDVRLDYNRDDSDIRLEVVTMRGLVLPRAGIVRNEYTSEEAMAAPLLMLAAYRVAQVMYYGTGRKLVALDECWQLGRVAAGRSLQNELARQSRKLNTRVLLASQQVGDMVTTEISNLIDCAFILRLEDRQAQIDALDAIRVSHDYAAALGTLSEHSRGSVDRSNIREALFWDGEGGVERMVLDMNHLPEHVRSAADTTPALATVAG